MDVAVVTDSTADLTPEMARQHGVTVVPALVVVQGKALRDGEEITREAFYRQLPAWDPPPTTAAPAVGEFAAVYRRLLEQGVRRILSLHCAATLSGIYNAARLAAQAFGERVQVMESGQLTLGLGFQVLEAVRALREGVSWEEMLERVKSVRRRVRVVAMLDTLEFLRRSGRVSWAEAGLGALLRIKPFVELEEGEVRSLPPVRTRRRGLARLREILASWGPLERLAVLHTGAEEDAQALVQQLPHPVAHPPLNVLVTPVIGVHVGPKGIGLVGVPAAEA